MTTLLTTRWCSTLMHLILLPLVLVAEYSTACSFRVVSLCRRRVARAVKKGRWTAGMTMLIRPAWPPHRPCVSLPGMQPSLPTVVPMCVCTLLDMQFAPPIISEIASSEILVLPVMLCTLITV